MNLFYFFIEIIDFFLYGVKNRESFIFSYIDIHKKLIKKLFSLLYYNG